MRYPSHLFISLMFAIALGAPTQAQELPDVAYLDGTFVLSAAPGDDEPPMGKLLVSAPLQLISQDGDWFQVSMQGWTQAGAERIIYAAPGIRVLHAVLSKSAVETLVFSEKTEDPDTFLIWTKTELQGWVNAPDLKPGLQDIWARAEPLFAKRCTACHQRRIPHHYTANQWTSHLKVMGPRTGLPKDDQFLIRAYLQYHAKDANRLGSAIVR